MRNLRPTAAHLAWGSLLIIVTLISLVSMAAAPQGAIAHPAQQHDTLRIDGIGVAAHRGAPHIAPENTLASVREGLATGSDFLEVDVWMTADDVPVLMHDRTIDRTTNGTGAIDTLTWSQVRDLDSGAWFSDEYAAEPVPTLAEVLTVVAPTQQTIFIELKGEWSEDQARVIADLIDAHGLAHRTAILSFNDAALRLIGQVHDEIARVWLVRKFDDLTLARVAELGVNGVGARLLMYERYPDMSRQLDSIGVVSLSYTLNDARAWSRARLLGVDIIVTDRAQALKEWADR